MNFTFKRPLEPSDLEHAKIPTRNLRFLRDGGSWSCEAYIDEQWRTVSYTAGSDVADVDGLAALATVAVEVI